MSLIYPAGGGAAALGIVGLCKLFRAREGLEGY